MDALNTFGLLFGAVITVLAAGATFVNKQKFEAQNALLQDGNDELRKQNKDLRDERTDLTAKNAALQARSDEKERTISELKNQPNLIDLTELISNNHKEIITTLSTITKGLIDGKPKR